MVRINVRDEGDSTWTAGRHDLTQRSEGLVSPILLSDLKGSKGEVCEWIRKKDGTWKFGNYSEPRWNEFLDDIRIHGIKEPIMVFVESNGDILIGEGNHRLNAAIQLRLENVPVDVRYFGNSQRKVNLFGENGDQLW